SDSQGQGFVKDLAIECHFDGSPASARFQFEILEVEAHKVFSLSELAQGAAQHHAVERQQAYLFSGQRHQSTMSQCLALLNADLLELQRVVVDHQGGTHERSGLTVVLQLQAQRAMVVPKRSDGRAQRNQTAATEALFVVLALFKQLWVEPHARVDKKDAVVELSE